MKHDELFIFINIGLKGNGVIIDKNDSAII